LEDLGHKLENGEARDAAEAVYAEHEKACRRARATVARAKP
jgi:hypothetical protein